MEYTTETYKGDGWTVIVKRPILSQAEREKREKYVVQTLESVYQEIARKEALANLLVAETKEKEEGDETVEKNQNFPSSHGLQRREHRYPRELAQSLF